MTTPTRRAWATIDCDALCRNLALVHSLCPSSAIYPVIKCNAYGHGMEQAARAIVAADTPIAGLAIATLTEALALKAMNLGRPILLLNGIVNEDELRLCIEQGIEPVVHAPYQVELLRQALTDGTASGRVKVWIKYNSGMNRLGLNGADCLDAVASLGQHPQLELVFMSHLAYADDMDNPASKAYTEKQLAATTAVLRQAEASCGRRLDCSLAASAGILSLPQTHFHIVRPGVMLYGSSPLATRTGPDCGLLPVMTLCSRLIAINEVKAGESIGYNATFTCDRDTRVGVVSIGYGDGYPRSAGNGTPVLVRTAGGSIRSRLIGRVSMDMITIDLTDIGGVQINDEVVLWGSELCADEVAAHADTIAYELYCQVTGRVTFDYG